MHEFLRRYAEADRRGMDIYQDFIDDGHPHDTAWEVAQAVFYLILFGDRTFH